MAEIGLGDIKMKKSKKFCTNIKSFKKELSCLISKFGISSSLNQSEIELSDSVYDFLKLMKEFQKQEPTFKTGVRRLEDL